jgi:hypothetical protein
VGQFHCWTECNRKDLESPAVELIPYKVFRVIYGEIRGEIRGGNSGTDGTFPSDTIAPIAGLPSPVSHRKDHDPRSKLLIHQAEGKLPESIFSEIHEVDRPALRSFPDFFYCLAKGAFKIDGSNWAALSIPIT